MRAPVALTMRQAQMIREAASKLAPTLRDRFRDGVDDVLARMPQETMTIRDGTGKARTFAYVADGTVQRAITWALRDLTGAAA